MHAPLWKKISVFIIFTVFFCIISLQTRNFLIPAHNNYECFLFKIDYIKNYGAAFSLFHTHTSFLIIVSIIILITAFYYIFSNITRYKPQDLLFSSLLCAGIICNLSERLVDGFVTDYIRLKFIIFPIFNISDIFICLGAFVLICNILFNNEQKNN